MINGFEKAVFLLAAADFKQRDVEDFVKKIKLLETSEAWTAISEAKMTLALSTSSTESPTLPHLAPTAHPTETIAKILQLLINDARLSKNQAAQILIKEIKKRLPRTEIPILNSKRGFSSWVEKLVKIVPESELLHLATIIRNEYVHVGSSDWKLR